MNDFNAVEIFLHFIKRLYENPVVKVITGFFILAVKLLFGTVFRPVYGAVIILWLVDLATGVYYARVNKEEIESRRLRRSVVKLFLYLGLLALGYQASLAELTMFIQTTVEGFIIFTEFYSILENIQKIKQLKGKKSLLLDHLMTVIQGRMKIEGLSADQIDQARQFIDQEETNDQDSRKSA